MKRIEKLIEALQRTRANMLGTDDEQHYWDCHNAATALRDMLAVVKAAERSRRELSSWIDGSNPDSRRILIHNCHHYLSLPLAKLEQDDG